jgi:hypothetical protein
VSVGGTTSQAQGHKKEVEEININDDFKKRKIFWTNIAENFLANFPENFPPHITTLT